MAAGLEVLLLGGTGFLGAHYMDAARARGHRVSVLSRKAERGDLPQDVELLVGDRSDSLDVLGGTWDAVFDLATFVPSWVRSIGETLRGRVGHYTFISSVAAYDLAAAGDAVIDESSMLKSDLPGNPWDATDPGTHYGGMKVMCEREAERQFPGRTVLLRPTYIVGPGDKVGAFTYLAARAAVGGHLLAAGDPHWHVHVVDVRDLATWSMELAERGEQGVFNAVGPREPLDWGGLLDAVLDISDSETSVTWIPRDWLVGRGEDARGRNLLFWDTGVPSGSRRIANTRALAHGFDPRPVAATARDTVAWFEALPAPRQSGALLGAGGNASLADLRAREQELLNAWLAGCG